MPGRLRREPFVPIEILGLADSEINLDGVDGRHRRHRPAARIDQGAHLELSLPRNAIDGGNEPRKIEVNPGRFDGSLSCPNLSVSGGHRCFCRQVVLDSVVKILLARGLLFGQRGVAVHVKLSPTLHGLGVGERSLGLRQLPLGLVKRSLKGTWVDLEQQLTFPDERTFLVALPLQIARDLRPDVSICESVERADPLTKNRDILLFNLHDFNFRGSPGRPRYVLWTHRPNDQTDGEQANRSAYPKLIFQKCVHGQLQQ